MRKTKNGIIETIFHECAETEEYQEEYRLIVGEKESFRREFLQKITRDLTRDELLEIEAELNNVVALSERGGFVLGFKYSFKLAAEIYSK
ncbi:MAG: hypothetical protein PHV95_09070 [Eubacteriales bacterium]|nr:hypothetical protein [Eubacteriales bacterium]MDD4475918.1 hypothetical protein [Eubacteriales bacterium]